MKKIIFTLAIFLGFGLSSVEAKGNGANNSESNVRTIKSPRFARPLIEKWIEEYAKTEPGVTFQIVKGSANQEDIDLNVVSDNNDNINTNGINQIIYFGETAVLPITARSSEAARLLEGKHLNAKKLKQLFFLNYHPLLCLLQRSLHLGLFYLLREFSRLLRVLEVVCVELSLTCEFLLCRLELLHMLGDLAEIIKPERSAACLAELYRIIEYLDL